MLSTLCAKVAADRQCGNPRCACHRDPQPGRNGPTVRVHCPAHDDPHPDLTVTDRGEGKWPLFYCHSAKCSQVAIVEALRARDVWPSLNGDRARRDELPTVCYAYTDEAGQPLHRTCRKGSGPSKKVWQEFLVDGRWVKRMPSGQRLVLYRLPKLMAASAAQTIYLAEGEKNADDVVRRLGLVATTNAMGALGWRPDYTRFFAGRLVALLEDNDAEGRTRTKRVAPELARAGAVVKVIRLPGLREHGDVSDWIAAGGTREQLEVIVDATPIWTAPERRDVAEERPAESPFKPKPAPLGPYSRLDDGAGTPGGKAYPYFFERIFLVHLATRRLLEDFCAGFSEHGMISLPWFCGGRIFHGRGGVIRAARAHVAWTVDGHKKGGRVL